MGGSESKETRVRYIDTTDQRAEDAAESQQRKIALDRYAKSKQNEKVNIERETLRKYQFGSMNGLAAFRDFNIEDMRKPGSLRIGLFGPAGAGKSSFIYSCERTLTGEIRGTADVKVQKAEGTIRVGDYLLGDWHFKLVDTRGFYGYSKGELNAFHDIIFGNLREGEEIDFAKNHTTKNKKGKPDHWIHSVVFVLNADDPQFWHDDLKDYLNPFRAYMRPKGIAPITILTHKDVLLEESPDKVPEAVERASTVTGSSLTHTFFITNYVGTEDQNPDRELDVCKVLNLALAMGERYVKFAKHDEKEEKAIASKLEQLELGESNKTIRDFFDELKSKHSLAAEKVDHLVTTLERNGIKNVSGLRTTWKTTKTRLAISRAMTRYIEGYMDELSK